MATEAQILTNRRLGRRIVLNFVFWSFEFVSNFDIRISDFNHSGCFMQNKPNLLNTQMNVSSVKTMNYEQITMNNANKNKANQTQFAKCSNRCKLSKNKEL